MKPVVVALGFTLFFCACSDRSVRSSAQVTASEIKLTASDASAGARFGQSVSMDGDRAVVGASADGAQGQYSGAVYVFERQPDQSWKEAAKLVPEAKNESGFFGSSVALDGDRIVVGEPHRSDGHHHGGMAHVFDRQPDGSWAHTKLPTGEASSKLYFGSRVLVDDDRIVVSVGQSSAYNPSPPPGQISVYDRKADGSWVETIIPPPQGVHRPEFGALFGFSDDRIVVDCGLPEEDQSNICVFDCQPDGTWSETMRFPAPRQRGQRFSMHDDDLLVGYADYDVVSKKGYPLLYFFDGPLTGDQTPVEIATRKDQTQRGAQGGRPETLITGSSTGIVLAGSVAVTGESTESSVVHQGGAVRYFRRTPDGVWKNSMVWPSDSSMTAHFGAAAGTDGTRLIVGSPQDDDHGEASGSAYIYEL